MAKQSIQLKVETRQGLGSRANKRLRDQGFIPAVIYGHKEAVVPVTVPKKEIATHLAYGAHVFDLTLDGGRGGLLFLDFLHLRHDQVLIVQRPHA